MPVSDTVKAIAAEGLVSSCFAFHSPSTGSTFTADAAVMRKFECVRKQVLDNLLQALGVRKNGSRQTFVEVDREFDVFGFGDVGEGAGDIAVKIVEQNLADLDHDRAGFDLRQIKNVVDQHQQVVAGAVNGFGGIGLFECEVTFGVLCQLVG